ncbi:MAG TPA: riboflavin synthase [Steroidobacteraceae bacterium]|nr:riboflavin synthase [Steroidobacteraceae bacterium]
MFTGIVQAVGTIAAVEAQGGDVQLVVAASDLDLAAVQLGDSIAVNGCCLTVTRCEGARFWADVSRETLNVTTLGQLQAGSPVNLEKALTAGQALGGHYVTGHVDGIARVAEMTADARSTRMVFEVPQRLARYIARKGSVCIDGVSLTINGVGDTHFDVNLIPHTLEVTTLGQCQPGKQVNIEVDIIARYVERLTSLTS